MTLYVLLAALLGGGIGWFFGVRQAAGARAELERLRQRQLRLQQMEAEAMRGASAANSTPALRVRSLEAALDSARMQLGASRVSLWEIDEPNGRAVPRHTLPGPAGRPVSLAGTPLRWVWEERVPLRLEAKGGSGWMTTDGGACVVSVGDDRLLVFEFEKGWLPQDATAAEDAGRYVAALLDLQRAEAGADKARLRFDHLLGVLERLTGVTTADAWAGELADTARILIGGSGAAVASWQGGTGRILATGGDDGGPAAGHAVDPSGSDMAIAAREGAPILRDEVRGGGLMPVAYAGERWYARPKALAVLPLETVDGVIGILAAWNADRSGLDDAGVATLRTLAPYAALQLRQIVMQDSLRERAERDALTGLPNRLAFNEKLDEAIKQYRRYHHPVSLIVFDVDHFKRVNDTWGHGAGDLVLREVGHILAASIRETDHAARIGGEEFAVLLTETELDHAIETAQRIRASLERASVDHEGTPLSVTISAGVSSCPSVVRDPGGLLSSADGALYVSKQQGRNRVTAASTLGRASGLAG